MGNVPVVNPLRYKRFLRRTSSTTAVRPETPVLQSRPDGHPFIHAPQPTRSIPNLASPPEISTPSSKVSSGPDTDAHAASAVSSAYSTHKRKKFVPGGHDKPIEDAITPASFLQGTQSHCIRHGRWRHQHPEDFHAPAEVRNALLKSKSGTYEPRGLLARRQMDAMSPWVVPKKPLTKTDAHTRGDDSDACHDCVAELRIKRKELQQGSVETARKLADHSRGFSKAVVPQTAAAVKHAVSRDKDLFDTSDGSDDDVFTSRDLGDKYDAVIIENQGELRRVVLNSRNEQPAAETMQRLSKDFVKIAQALAFGGLTHAPPTPISTQPSNAPNSRDTAILVTANTVPPSSKAPILKVNGNGNASVPELLSMIDKAASDIHLSTDRLAEHYIERKHSLRGERQNLLNSEDFRELFADPSPTEALVRRQSIDEHYRDLHQRLAYASTRKNSAALPSSGPPLKAQGAASVPEKFVYRNPSAIPTPLSVPTATFIPSIVRTRPAFQRRDSRANAVSPTTSSSSETPSIRPRKSRPAMPERKSWQWPSCDCPPGTDDFKPEHLHHAPELAEVIAPAQTQSTSSAAPPAGSTPLASTAPTPAQLVFSPTSSAATTPNASTSKTPFYAFLNPFFNHTTPKPSPTVSPTATPTPKPPPGLPLGPTPASNSANKPLQQSPPQNPPPSLGPTPTATPINPPSTLLTPSTLPIPTPTEAASVAKAVDITTHPQPYHHAPAAPSSLDFAQYLDPVVQARQVERRAAKAAREVRDAGVRAGREVRDVGARLGDAAANVGGAAMTGSEVMGKEEGKVKKDGWGGVGALAAVEREVRRLRVLPGSAPASGGQGKGIGENR